ncbi:Sensor protein VraS [compost metagenome]
MRYSSTGLLSGAIFVFSLVLLIAVGAWYLETDSSKPVHPSLHLTQASWQASDAASYSAAPTAVDSKTLGASWQPVRLPQALPLATLSSGAAKQSTQAVADANAIRTTWIRLTPDAASVPNEALVLYGVRVKTEGTIAVYVNGHLVQRMQQEGTLWNSLFTPLWIPLDKIGAATPLNEILLRLEHPAETRVGMSSLWLGPTKALQGRYYARQWLQRELPATLSAAFLVVGIFSLFVWFRRGHEIAYLLFFNLAAISFVGHLHYYVGLPIKDDLFAWLTSNALFWLIAIIHLFLRQLHGHRLVWLTRAIVTIVLLISALTLFKVLPYYPSTSILVPIIYGVAVVLGATVSIVGVVYSWRHSRDGMLIAIGCAISTLLGLSDWLLYSSFIDPEGWFLGSYTNAITFAMFGTLMYRRYINAIAEVELANAHLAQRLQQRENELDVIHRQLRESALRQTISDERQRLMQDMHDGLGSSLISAIRSVEQGGASDLKVAQILKDCLDDLKLTIDSMEPVEADLLLLLATLRFRLEPRLEGTGIKLQWEVQELPTLVWLDPSSALHILRIVQESIANILRHTRANEIRVSTAPAEDGVTVTITDNGQGFDIDKALGSAAGRGLHNQQRRALALAGRVSWTSTASGTRFELWLPLQRQEAIS